MKSVKKNLNAFQNKSTVIPITNRLLIPWVYFHEDAMLLKATLGLMSVVGSGFFEFNISQASPLSPPVTYEYTGDFEMAPQSLEEYPNDKVVGLSRIEENEVEDDSTQWTKPKIAQPNRTIYSKPAVPISTNTWSDDGVPIEVLHSERERYRSYLSPSLEKSGVENRFLGSLTHSGQTQPEVIKQEHEPVKLAREKIYTVENGKIVEIIPNESQHKQNNVEISSDPSPDSSASRFQKMNIRGHVNVPLGVDPGRVVLRMAGTPWQIQADSEGFFEFQSIPTGSKFEIIAWHLDGGLNRRIIPVSVTEAKREYQFDLERTQTEDARAAAFGLKQDMNLSGFCAQLSAREPLIWEGAKLLLTSSAAAQGPYYFNKHGLPDIYQKEISTDGRFCVFNAKSNLVGLQILTLNGMRRSFQVHLEPSTFETQLNFDLDSSVYRPVVPAELVDSEFAFHLAHSGEKAYFGNSQGRNWIQGKSSAIWNSVTNLDLRTESAYGPQPMDENNSQEMRYFPVGQELVEIAWSENSDTSPGGFQLLSRDNIYTDSMNDKLKKLEFSHKTFSDPRNVLGLKVMDSDARQALQDIFNENEPEENDAAAFVSINLAALNLEYSDLKISLRDSWTGLAVAPFRIIPLAPEIKNPRIVRGFFGKIPPGQHTLLVTDKKGELRWIDIVRARPGSFQIVPIRD